MKRQLVAVLTALSMITLTACNEKPIQEDSQTVESSETILTSVTSETVVTTKTTETEENTSLANNNSIVIQGESYSYDRQFIFLELEELTEEDVVNLNKFNDLCSLGINMKNSNISELEFLIQLKNLTSISLISASGEMSDYISLFNKLTLSSITFDTENYKDSDFELLASTFPACEISYIQNEYKWNKGAPTRGFIGYADPVVSSSSTLTAHLTNITEETCTAKTLEIYSIISDEWSPVTFTNG